MSIMSHAQEDKDREAPAVDVITVLRAVNALCYHVTKVCVWGRQVLELRGPMIRATSAAPPYF